RASRGDRPPRECPRNKLRPAPENGPMAPSKPRIARLPCRDLDSVHGRFLWSPAMGLRGIISVWVGVAIAWHSSHARADAAEVEALIAKGNELRRAGTAG